MQLFIAGDEPDIIIITIKFHHLCVMHCYHYLGILDFNFDCGSVQNSLRSIGIYITDTLSATKITFPTDFEEHLWISLKLYSSDVLTVDCI